MSTKQQIARLTAEVLRLRERLDSIAGPDVVNSGRGGIRFKGTPPRPPAIAGGLPPNARFKISDSAPTDPATDDDAQDNVMLANLYDGVNTDTVDIPIRTNQSHSEGDEVLCIRPQNGVLSNDGTEVTYNNLPVVWQETLSAGTDYTVYIDAIVAGTDNGGKYTGYCYKTQPPLSPALSGIPCEIWVDDERYSTNSFPSDHSQAHWSQLRSIGIGRFNGEYNADVPPKPIIHASGFAPNMVNSGTFATLPFGTQIWVRESAYADTSNPANIQTGDAPVKISICTRQDLGTKFCFFREFWMDASGRLQLISHE